NQRMVAMLDERGDLQAGDGHAENVRREGEEFHQQRAALRLGHFRADQHEVAGDVADEQAEQRDESQSIYIAGKKTQADVLDLVTYFAALHSFSKLLPMPACYGTKVTAVRKNYPSVRCKMRAVFGGNCASSPALMSVSDLNKQPSQQLQ